jgi:hypothetical protein
MFNVKLHLVPASDKAIGFEVENAIKLPKLRSLVAADLVGDVEVVGRRGGWVIRVITGEASPPVLAAATGAIRVFTTADSAIQQLIRLGVTRFQVIADEYESGTLRASRPDRALRGCFPLTKRGGAFTKGSCTTRRGAIRADSRGCVATYRSRRA